MSVTTVEQLNELPEGVEVVVREATGAKNWIKQADGHLVCGDLRLPVGFFTGPVMAGIVSTASDRPLAVGDVIAYRTDMEVYVVLTLLPDQGPTYCRAALFQNARGRSTFRGVREFSFGTGYNEGNWERLSQTQIEERYPHLGMWVLGLTALDSSVMEAERVRVAERAERREAQNQVNTLTRDVQRLSAQLAAATPAEPMTEHVSDVRLYLTTTVPITDAVLDLVGISVDDVTETEPGQVNWDKVVKVTNTGVGCTCTMITDVTPYIPSGSTLADYEVNCA